jgi:sugar lactone lactonase YvrE
VNDQNAHGHNVGQITPTGQVSEFQVCPDRHRAGFGRDPLLHQDRRVVGADHHGRHGAPGYTRHVLPNGNGLDAHGNDIWFADFSNHSVWRYDIPTDAFTEFLALNTVPLDVAVAVNGIVWFTDANGQIGRLDPTTRVVTEIDVEGFPCEINIASDGAVWFTERFAPQAVGRINPATNAVTLFPVDDGPEEIAPAVDGSMWFIRSTAGNIVRMSRPPVSSRPSRRPSRAANPSGSRSPPTATPGS